MRNDSITWSYATPTCVIVLRDRSAEKLRTMLRTAPISRPFTFWCGASAGGAGVPEPMTMALLALGGCALLRRRRVA